MQPYSPIYSPGLAESLYEQLEPLTRTRDGFNVEIVRECDSTNTRLLDRARSGDTQPTLLVTERQSAGRGRQGRQWLGEPGHTLMFSLGLPLNPRSWSGLSLVVGVELAQALHPDIRIKWPNDLWIGDAKLAGILVETANVARFHDGTRYVVLGCGINIEAPAVDAAHLRTPAVGLRTLRPEATAAQALAQVAQPLLNAVLAFETAGFEPWRAEFSRRDALAGLDIRMMEGERVLGSGTACGVNDEGCLLMHTAEGMSVVSSGEVSVRPYHPRPLS